MTWREIAADKLDKLQRPTIIDVRSPCEFAAERIPEAINVPLLDDGQRAVIGTVYAKEGEIAARRLALQVISPKIPSIVDQILQLRRQDSALVVHCWRGGLRSEAVASFLTIVGIDCWRLQGGYKAWRKMVLNDFSSANIVPNCVVIQGLTGAGKTDLLTELSMRGQNVLDLEEIANHRGSLFGALGLEKQPTQKNFEAALWKKLKSFQEKSGAENSVIEKPLFVEAEGRKIGKLSLPDCLVNQMNKGEKVLLETSITARVARLSRIYAPCQSDQFKQELLKLVAADWMIERLGHKTVTELENFIQQGSAEEFVELLLERYYDPMYSQTIAKDEPFDFHLSGEDPGKAADELLAWKNAVCVVAG